MDQEMESFPGAKVVFLCQEENYDMKIQQGNTGQLNFPNYFAE